MLLLRCRKDLGVMAIKGYSAFPKAPALLEPHIWTFVVGRKVFPSAEMQLAHSTDPTSRPGYPFNGINENIIIIAFFQGCGKISHHIFMFSTWVYLIASRLALHQFIYLDIHISSTENHVNISINKT